LHYEIKKNNSKTVLNSYLPILLAVVTLPLYGQVTDEPIDSLYQVGLSDLEFHFDKIENDYVSGRRGLSDEEWNRGVERVHTELDLFFFGDEGQGSYVYIWRYLNLIKDDAHFKFPDTGMYNRWEYFKKEDHIFPLWVQTWHDGTVYNEKDFTDKIPRYAQIHTVNGHSAKDMALLSRALAPGEEANAMAMINYRYEARPLSWPNFTNHLFMEGISAPFEVVYSLPDSDRQDTVVLNGITREEKHKLTKRIPRRARGLSPGKPVVYENIDESIGVLSLNSFWGKRWSALILFSKDWRCKRLLRGAMRRIDRNGIENLIVDVSRNSGGMTENVYYTLNYFTDKAVDMNKVYKVTDASREMIRTNISNSPEIAENDRERLIGYVGGLESGTVFSTDTLCNLKYLPDNPKRRFKGNVYVLTSPITYSAGQMFAQYCQTLEIGLTAGQHSGGYRAITGGNLAKITMPLMSRFEFGVPFGMEKVEEGDPYDYPEVDIPIDHPLDEWLKRENHSLERLIEIVKSGDMETTTLSTRSLD
jgi:hypothetical protein